MILKKEHFEKVGFDVQEIYPRIFLVENFIKKEESDHLMATIKRATQEDWEHKYLDNLKPFCMEKFGRDDVENLVKEGKFSITTNWHDKVLSIEEDPEDYRVSLALKERLESIYQEVDHVAVKGVGIIQRQYQGVPLKSHVDQTTDPSVEYASVIYLNDDYTDGEIYFEKIGLRLKPKAGSMLTFPGTEEYEHGVDAPGVGPMRYVLPSFIVSKGHYETHRY